MDDIDALVRALRWREACELSLSRGARVRAFEIAIEARDVALQERLAACLIADEESAALAAAIRRSDPIAEGLVLSARGHLDAAAECFERAGDHRRAARALLAAGRVADGGRALEAHLRDHPEDHGACVELAELCLSLGRGEAALRALRGVTTDAARTLTARARAAMGLDGGATEQGASPWLFGRYEVVREVATTATSRVLEAIDRLEPGAPRVALKVFVGGGQTGAGRDALVRFEREVRIASALDAPSVLRPRAFLPEGPTLVLPWLGGGSVAALLERGPLPPRRAAEIVDRVLVALSAAHRRGIVHRDIKPSNILLDDAGGAFLSDFGVAHLGDAGATATAGLLGTGRYMSPEQKAGEPATPASDLYATGVLLEELLGTGGDLPPAVRALVARFRHDTPDGRPGSADEARMELAAIAWPDDLAGGARAASGAPVAPSAGRFVEEADGVFFDTLLERRETRVSLTSPLAAALLQVHDRWLPSVLGRAGDCLRVELPEGRPCTDEGLPEPERAALRATRARLATLGIAAPRLVTTPRGPLLRFDPS